jgi:hypothetical protein
MFLSFLSKLTTSFLVAVLLGAVITAVFTQTLLNSHYLEGQLAKTNSYQKLSVALSQQIAQSPSVAGNPAATTQIQGILTPAVLQQKITTTLDQMQKYYDGTGPQPTLDLTDLAAQAQAAGVPVGEDSGITKPITLGSSGQTADHNVGKTVSLVHERTVITSVLLAMILALFCWRRRNYKPLPNVLISVGVFVGLLALSLWLTPGLINRVVTLPVNSNAFVGVVRDLATSISQDLGKRFGIIAGVCLAVGIPIRIWFGRLDAKRHPRPNFNNIR